MLYSIKLKLLENTEKLWNKGKHWYKIILLNLFNRQKTEKEFNGYIMDINFLQHELTETGPKIKFHQNLLK